MRMSHDAVDRFLSLIQTDPALQRELGPESSESGGKPRMSMQRFVELGEKHGFRFSVEELRARLTSRALSDEELGQATGGAVRSDEYLKNYGFTVQFSPLGGGGFNQISLDDTAGSEKKP